MNAVSGTVVPGFEPLLDFAREQSARDPEWEFQLSIRRGADVVVDLWGGSTFTAESLLIPMSVSKASIAFCVGVLVDRGELDLDAPVARYWPEFAQAGKAGVTVAQLLSHQAGIPQTTPLSDEDAMEAPDAAARLAAELPWWRPGVRFGYHALTIGVLGAELVRRASGRAFREFFEDEIRGPRGFDFHLGSTPQLEERVVETLPMVRPDGPRPPMPFERAPGQIMGDVFGDLSTTRPPDAQLEWARRRRAYGNPAGYATVSARGIAALYAECAVGVTGPALVSEPTRRLLAQTQVAGTDAVIGIERRYGIVFQKPSPNLAYGSRHAFGHDGAGGALGFHDPLTQLSFGYTVRRTPFPGGADARAIEAAQIAAGLVS